jgi:hypothetical protein
MYVRMNEDPRNPGHEDAEVDQTVDSFWWTGNPVTTKKLLAKPVFFVRVA